MKVLAFGELLWDVIEGREHIGGAPFNLAAHLSRMGVTAAMVTALGEDERGKRALEEADRLGIRTDLISSNPTRPTGVVHVSLDRYGKPTFDIREDSAWDAIRLSEAQWKVVSGESWDVIVFGTLAQRTPHNAGMLADILQAAQPEEVFLDVNLRQNYFSSELIRESLCKATILKLNDEEVPVVSEIVFGRTLPDEEFCRRVGEKMDIHTTVLTRGKEGASVYRGGRYVTVPVIDVRVADTVGAGDSFSAGFLYGFYQTGDILKAARFAAKLGSFVASQNGAVPPYDEDIRQALKEITP